MKSNPNDDTKSFQILSLSGGGFLGLYTIKIIEKIEEDLGKPISHCFDLIAGTSIGGIVALALAAEIPAKDIRKAFEDNGEKIFPRKFNLKNIFKLRSLIKIIDYFDIFLPKNNSEALKTTIELIVGDNKMSDLKHAVIVPTVNLTKGSTQLFKTPHHESFKRDLHLKLVDVALATSAAPIYFPLAEINNQLFADGGLYLNSPDLAALHEAEMFFGAEKENIKMLSIGTTTSKFSLAHKVGKNLGVFKWIIVKQRLFKAIISSQQINSNFLMNHKLGDNYLRIDETLSGNQEQYLSLDNATPEAIKTIKGIADSSYQRYVNNKTLQNIISKTKRPTSFYNL